MMPAWLTFRGDLRSRWLTWTQVGVLISLVCGLALAAAAGARRTEAAYPQLVSASRAADQLVFDSEPNPQIPVMSGARVESLPEVAAAGHLRSFATAESVNAFGSPAGDAYVPGRGINQPHLIAGRPFASGRAGEVLIDYTLARQDHLGPGRRLSLHFLRPVPGKAWLVNYAARPLAVTLRVTGVVATPGQFPPQDGDYFSGPAVYLTPAFLDAHRHDLAQGDVSVVRLKPGRSGAFTAALNRLLGPGQQADTYGIALSPLAPVGGAAAAELHPGVAVDVPVVLGLPAPAVLGIRLALDPGQGRADVPGRSTLAVRSWAWPPLSAR